MVEDKTNRSSSKAFLSFLCEITYILFLWRFGNINSSKQKIYRIKRVQRATWEPVSHIRSLSLTPFPSPLHPRPYFSITGRLPGASGAENITACNLPGQNRYNSSSLQTTTFQNRLEVRLRCSVVTPVSTLSAVVTAAWHRHQEATAGAESVTPHLPLRFRAL